MRWLRMPAAIAVLTVAASLFGARSAKAQDYCAPGFVPDVFYNYYVGPVACCDHGALGRSIVCLAAAGAAARRLDLHHLSGVESAGISLQARALLLEAERAIRSGDEDARDLVALMAQRHDSVGVHASACRGPTP